jgi:hypothetical protein
MWMSFEYCFIMIPTEIWEMILNKTSFRDCLRLRLTCKLFLLQISIWQPKRFLHVQHMEEWETRMEQGIPFITAALQKNHSIHVSGLDSCLIRIGPCLLLLHVRNVPISWLLDGNSNNLLQLHVHSCISIRMDTNSAVKSIYHDGTDTYSLSLLQNQVYNYDTLMMDCIPKFSEQESMNWIKKCLENGYVLKRMYEGTIGCTLDSVDSQKTLYAQIEQDCYFEIPHWQYYFRRGDSCYLHGQETGMLFTLDEMQRFYQHLVLIKKRWTRIYKHEVYKTSRD